MKKVMFLIALVMFGFSNAMLVSVPSSLLENNLDELLDGKVFSNPCHKCRRGPTGPQGPQGPRGPMGPPGPPGPTLATFISLYALEQQVVAPGDPILFQMASAQNGSITWPGSNTGEIIVSTAGTYQISFGTQPIFNARMSLRVNNVNVPGGTLSIDLSIPFSTLTLDVVIPANSTITIVNTGISPINLQSGGPDPDATVAFIEVHRIL